MSGVLPAALQLRSPAARLQAACTLTNHVYGPCAPNQAASWCPRKYADNKGRYLWTDAFGVVNFLTLAAETGSVTWLEQAERLISAVHDTLGKTRDGSRRLGSATAEEPTRGGLRIGKVHDEGHPDGDGQYYHYLTKWAFALNRMSLVRGDPKYNRMAVQLMEAAHPHFVHGSGSSRLHMWWKVSIDMQRPLVASEGNLDPFDGLVTCRILQETAGDPRVLQREIADMEAMVANKYRRYISTDPLDLGEALWLAHWALPEQFAWALLVGKRSLAALEALWAEGYFRQAPQHRLAFREFGATLGLQVNSEAGAAWQPRVDQLHDLWAQQLFTRDADITPVMFCASLVPGAWSRTYGDKLRSSKLRRQLGIEEQ